MFPAQANEVSASKAVLEISWDNPLRVWVLTGGGKVSDEVSVGNGLRMRAGD